MKLIERFLEWSWQRKADRMFFKSLQKDKPSMLRYKAHLKSKKNNTKNLQKWH